MTTRKKNLNYEGKNKETNTLGNDNVRLVILIQSNNSNVSGILKKNNQKNRLPTQKKKYMSIKCNMNNNNKYNK